MAQHGTPTAYRYGCRCPDCKTAHREAEAAANRKRLAELGPPPARRIRKPKATA